MDRKVFVLTTVACVLAVLCFSTEAFAQTADFGAAEFNAQSTKIRDFLFGPAMRFAGILGGAYGLVQAIMSATVKPLLVFGGIGLGVNLIPKFVDGVFSVSGMLLG